MLKEILSTTKGRLWFFNFCLENFYEDITANIEIRDRPYPELTRVALNIKQEIMEKYNSEYRLMKREVEKNV